MPQGHYTAHLDRMTIPVHSPFWARTHHRHVMITPQQYRLVARVLPGWRGNQRDLAASLGYSLSGLNEAIRTLSKLGILARLTQRGRNGWTRLVMVRGVHLTNVRERISRALRAGLSTLPNISWRVGDDGSLAASARGASGGLRTRTLADGWHGGVPVTDHRQAVPAR